MKVEDINFSEMRMNVKEYLRGKTWEDGYGRGYNSALEKIERCLKENNQKKLHKKEWDNLNSREKIEVGNKYLVHEKEMNKLTKLSHCLKYFIDVLETDIGCAEKFTIIKTPIVPINATCFFDKYKTGMVEEWKGNNCEIFIFIPFDEWNLEIEDTLYEHIDKTILNRM